MTAQRTPAQRQQAVHLPRFPVARIIVKALTVMIMTPALRMLAAMAIVLMLLLPAMIMTPAQQTPATQPQAVFSLQ